MTEQRKLLLALENAWVEGYDFFGVKIQVEDAPTPEIIVFGAESFSRKADYYLENYNEDLKLRSNTDIQIVGYQPLETQDKVEDFM